MTFSFLLPYLVLSDSFTFHTKGSSLHFVLMHSGTLSLVLEKQDFLLLTAI